MAASDFRPSRVRTAADVYALIGDASVPAVGAALHTVHLDGAGRVLGVSVVALPGAARATLREAIALGSVAIVAAHLGRFAEPWPAEPQLSACAELVEAARALGIKVLDYLLFGATDFRSFRALGLL